MTVEITNKTELKKKKSSVRKPVISQLPEESKDQAGPPAPFPVVGIGASAGGIEAIINLLSNLKPDLGMAYVIVQHLSPDRDCRRRSY